MNALQKALHPGRFPEYGGDWRCRSAEVFADFGVQQAFLSAVRTGNARLSVDDNAAFGLDQSSFCAALALTGQGGVAARDRDQFCVLKIDAV